MENYKFTGNINVSKGKRHLADEYKQFLGTNGSIHMLNCPIN